MKNTKSYLPIYVLSASLVISSLIYANTANSAQKYVTVEQYQKDLKAISTDVGNVRVEVRSFRSCYNSQSSWASGRVC